MVRDTPSCNNAYVCNFPFGVISSDEEVNAGTSYDYICRLHLNSVLDLAIGPESGMCTMDMSSPQTIHDMSVTTGVSTLCIPKNKYTYRSCAESFYESNTLLQ